MMPMEAIGDGILTNYIQTRMQRCYSWKEIAYTLFQNGYCALRIPTEDTVTNIICRIDNPTWKDWGKCPHTYRMTYSSRVWGVPAQIMNLLQESQHSLALGYIKSQIQHPQSHQCTANWLMQVMKCSNPTNAQGYKKGRDQEIIDYLREMGYCRIGRIKIKGHGISQKVIARIDSNFWQLQLPENMREFVRLVLQEHHYRAHISQDKWVNVPDAIYNALPDSVSTETGCRL